MKRLAEEPELRVQPQDLLAEQSVLGSILSRQINSLLFVNLLAQMTFTNTRIALFLKL